MSRKAIVMAISLGLVACGKTSPVPERLAIVAHHAVDEEYQLKGPRDFSETWFGLASPSSEIVCGTFEPQPIEAEYETERRYIFTESGGVLIDPIPELQVTLSSTTQSILEETERVFEEAWMDGCEDFRPGFFAQVIE